jgi:predicted MPP superfamily phosphohydrolase
MLKERNLRRALLALFAFGLALAVDGFWIEPSRLVVHREELHIPKWPAALSGLRVAFVSDLHVGSPHWGVDHLRGLVERVNAEQPDLILLGGDYLINGVTFGEHVPVEPIAAELARLHAPLGVIAVLGNHDWWNDGPHVRAAFEARGIAVLDDEARPVTWHGASFCVLGLRDEVVRDHSLNQELKLALPGLPLIVMVHEPDIFAQMDDRASLTLSGHTHGGQVALPLLGRLVVPSAFGQRYAAGHIVENGRHLFVTTGVGTSILPVRFGVPPEIALLTLAGQS